MINIRFISFFFFSSLVLNLLGCSSPNAQAPTHNITTTTISSQNAPTRPTLPTAQNNVATHQGTTLNNITDNTLVDLVKVIVSNRSLSATQHTTLTQELLKKAQKIRQEQQHLTLGDLQDKLIQSLPTCLAPATPPPPIWLQILGPDLVINTDNTYQISPLTIEQNTLKGRPLAPGITQTQVTNLYNDLISFLKAVSQPNPTTRDWQTEARTLRKRYKALTHPQTPPPYEKILKSLLAVCNKPITEEATHQALCHLLPTLPPSSQTPSQIETTLYNKIITQITQHLTNITEKTNSLISRWPQHKLYWHAWERLIQHIRDQRIKLPIQVETQLQAWKTQLTNHEIKTLEAQINDQLTPALYDVVTNTSDYKRDNLVQHFATCFSALTQYATTDLFTSPKDITAWCKKSPGIKTSLYRLEQCREAGIIESNLYADEQLCLLYRWLTWLFETAEGDFNYSPLSPESQVSQRINDVQNGAIHALASGLSNVALLSENPDEYNLFPTLLNRLAHLKKTCQITKKTVKQQDRETQETFYDALTAAQQAFEPGDGLGLPNWHPVPNPALTEHQDTFETIFQIF